MLDTFIIAAVLGVAVFIVVLLIGWKQRRDTRAYYFRHYVDEGCSQEKARELVKELPPMMYRVRATEKALERELRRDLERDPAFRAEWDRLFKDTATRSEKRDA